MSDKLMPTEGDGSDKLNMDLGESGGIPGMPGMPIGGPLGSSGSPASKSKVSGQVMIAGAVLVLAAGVIYGMRFVGLNAGGPSEDVRIDYTSESSAEAAQRFERVMTELDESMLTVQVIDAGRLQTSPFTLGAVDEIPTDEPKTLDDLDRLARYAADQERLKQEERMALVRGELSRLQVQGVIGGRVPAARINGQPVRVGQSLGVFEVIRIEKQSVFVQADGAEYELRIGLEPRLVD